ESVAFSYLPGAEYRSPPLRVNVTKVLCTTTGEIRESPDRFVTALISLVDGAASKGHCDSPNVDARIRREVFLTVADTSSTLPIRFGRKTTPEARRRIQA